MVISEKTHTHIFGARLVCVFKNWKLLFKNICGNTCGWKSALKYVKCCLKTENGGLKSLTKHHVWYWLLCQFWYSQFKLWELSLQGRKIGSTRKAITFLSSPTQLILIKIHCNFLIPMWNLIFSSFAYDLLLALELGIWFLFFLILLIWF